MDELIRDLQNLPEELATEAALIVQRTASETAQEARAIYQAHRHTGNLAEHVVVETRELGRYGAISRVKSTARHAWLFEHGTEARHYTTASGAKHETGKMWGKRPPVMALRRIAPRKRREMYQKLRELLLRHGAATVEGEP